MAYKAVSLFSGAMGLDLGIERAGFETILCLENNPAAVKTIKLNRPNLAVISKSIEEVTGEEIRKICGLRATEELPLLAGGPPCQSFSVFGNRLGIKDSRGQLIFEFIRLTNELRPSTFLIENVRGLLSMSVLPNTKKYREDKKINKRLLKKGSLLQMIFKKFDEIGYSVDCFVVNAANYGAPQIRERVILIGNKYGMAADFPKPTHSNREEDNLPPFKNLGDVIGPDSGFIDTCKEVLDFSPRKLKYLSMVPEGGNWRSLALDIQKESMGKSWYLKGGRSAYWRKLSFAFPSPTVVTMPNHAGTSMCHPKELRAISVGEAAAIQEFPCDWKFVGSTGEKFKQIGNAVPIRLGEISGSVVKWMVTNIKKKERNSTNSLVESGRVIHIRPHVRTRTFWKNGKAYNGDISYYEIPNVLQTELSL